MTNPVTSTRWDPVQLRAFATCVRWLAVALTVGATVAAPAQSQAPVIASFGRNGELVCTHLQPGSTASVVWADSLLGPWTNSPPGLEALKADINGSIRVSVPVLSRSLPMFCRVRGTPQSTNPAPPVNMVLIPAGPFTMGDSLDGDSFALPLHTVQVGAFYMDPVEVTKGLWDEVQVWANAHGYDLGTIGSGPAPNDPVRSVIWFAAVKWCNARSEKEGRVPAYYTDEGQTVVYRTGTTNVQNDWVKWNGGYRLPTEAEWEKAARGGSSGQRFPWGNNITHSLANYYSSASYVYDASSTRGYHPDFRVGVPTNPGGYFAANAYGLFDMAGNVWEWTWDWSGVYNGSPETDPRGPASGKYRAIRGGSWYSRASDCRPAARGSYWPDSADNGIGFRSVLPQFSLEQQTSERK